MLTTHEERLLLDLLMLCHSTKEKSDFDAAHKVLCRLMPHTKCFVGIMSTRNKNIKYHINYGFTDEFVQRFLLDQSTKCELLLSNWFDECSPIFHDLNFYDYPRHCYALKHELSKYGVRNILTHGVMDIGKSAASHFIFTNIEKWNEHTKHIACTITPILHSLISSVYFNEKVDSSSICGIMLTNREQEILRWISQGKTNTEIGIILSISHWTVKVHIGKILKKFNANTRSQAVTSAIDMNLIMPFNARL